MSSPQHEPTMEEILASIRKIISEDAPEGAAPAAAAPPAPPPAPRHGPGARARSRSDVLELTQELSKSRRPPAAPAPSPNRPGKRHRLPSRCPAQCARDERIASDIFSDTTRKAMDDTFANIPDEEPAPAPRAAHAVRAGGRRLAWKSCSNAPCAKASSRCCSKYLSDNSAAVIEAHEAPDPRMDGRAFPRPAGRRGPRRSGARGKGARHQALNRALIPRLPQRPAGPVPAALDLTDKKPESVGLPDFRGFPMLDKTFNPKDVEGRIYAQWEASGAFKPRPPPGRRALLHRDPAAQCHRAAAYRPRPQQHPAGHPGPLRAHARQGCAVAAGHRPCRHRHPADRRAPAGRTADEPHRPGPREIPGRSVEVEGRIRRRHCRAAAPAGRQRRLEPRTLHHGRGAVAAPSPRCSSNFTARA